MVKYGKLYRELQIKEFKGNYINYKRLKQKIKAMQEILPRTSQEIITKRTSNNPSIKINLRASLSDIGDESGNVSTSPSNINTYDAQVKEFKELLDQEFQVCYKFFKKIKRQLHNKLNNHLLSSTNYSSYNIQQIIKEIGELRRTIYLAKCLNAFINDNMMAIKKILKKFDKKFYNYFGNFGPKYILDNLCMHNSDLEYLLQFKIIDESSSIIESNIILLRECFLEIISSNKNLNVDKNNFERSYNEILEFIRDIDELIYFKIQYKEWFYFRKKDDLITTNSKLYKNLMFNPILFSAYHKDDLMNKFLSRKEEIKEVEQMQIPLSKRNKINIVLIFIQTFFYNTLISGIYPILIINMKNLGEEKGYIRYSLLIISSTYISSYFSILFYHYLGSKKIKIAYIISYFLFFIGSLLYILSFQNNDDYNTTIGLLVGSRILIGLGANPTMGKKYILSYASKYFLPLISKIFVLVSILGHAFGPLITFVLFSQKEEEERKNGEKEITNFLTYFYYSNNNSIGYYGFIMSFILIIVNIIFFTNPKSKVFNKMKKKTNGIEQGNYQPRETPFLVDDLEDTQDKEFYRLQKEMKNKISSDISEEDNNTVNSLSKINSMTEKKNELLNEKESDNDIGLVFQKTTTLDENKDIEINAFSSKYELNPLLYTNDYKGEMEENLGNENESGNFVNINMIPRTIEDLIRKEKKTLSYLNSNLFIILIILFFCNLLKENSIAYCSYYIGKRYEESYFKEIFQPKYLCLLISCSYLLQIFSIIFIFPFYRINTLIKKFLIILMVSTIILMIPLTFEIDLLSYYIIISFIILISSIIEVLSSCYLAYLTPPEWKFSHMNAGSLPLYIMTFGKLIGCLICLAAFININLINNRIVVFITLLAYGISGFYILKSKNFRIKAIARIMRKSELESYIL